MALLLFAKHLTGTSGGAVCCVVAVARGEQCGGNVEAEWLFVRRAGGQII